MYILEDTEYIIEKKIDHEEGRLKSEEITPQPVLSQSDEPHSITSLNFENLSDSDSQEFIRELEEKESKTLLLPIFGIVPSILIFLFFWIWSNTIIDTTEQREQFFKVSKEVVNLRKMPTTSSEVIGKAELGQQLKIIDSFAQNRTKVLTAQNDTAFVYNSLGQTIDVVVERIQKTRFYGIEWLQIFLAILLATGLIFWSLFLSRQDRKRKSIELYYSMEKELEEMYNKFLNYFKEFMRSIKIWQQIHSERSVDTKYTGGADKLVRRVQVHKLGIDSKPTTFIKTNVQIPHIKLKNTELFFFPERLVLKRNRKFASVFYKNLEIDYDSTRIIESEGVPKDADVVDHTWTYVNKRGGPDKRFKDNRKLPICQYSEYHFHSKGGINEVINTAKQGAMDKLVNLVKQIGKQQNK